MARHRLTGGIADPRRGHRDDDGANSSEGSHDRSWQDEVRSGTSGALTHALTLLRSRPMQSVKVTGALVAASVLEVISIATLIPLLAILTDRGGKPSTVTRVFNEVIEATGLAPTLLTVLAVIVFAMLFKAAFALLAARMVGYATGDLAWKLRGDYLNALIRSNWAHFIETQRGHIVIAMNQESRRAATGYIQACRLVALVVQIAAYVALSAMVSWQATVVAVAFGIANIVLLRRFVETARRESRDATILRQAMSANLNELLDSMKALKAMGREEQLGNVLAEDNFRLRQIRRRLVMNRQIPIRIQEVLYTLLLAAGLFIFTTLWNIPLEGLIVLSVLFLRTAQRLGGLQTILQAIAAAESVTLSYGEMLNKAVTAREQRSGGRAPVFDQAIHLDGLTLSYGTHKVLDGVDMVIPMRSLTALTGPSGAGKTTIADMLAGLITPSDGTIWIDKTPLSDLDLEAWRSMIGYVPQHSYLFHNTIFHNIAFYDETIDYDAVRDALIAAGAWEFVSQLPDQMDSKVGELGRKLSGGQIQRLALARALVRKPKLLILDEPTSALDVQAEREILDTVCALKSRIAILFVSHRPAVRDVADQTYLLRDGMVTDLHDGA